MNEIAVRALQALREFSTPSLDKLRADLCEMPLSHLISMLTHPAPIARRLCSGIDATRDQQSMAAATIAITDEIDRRFPRELSARIAQLEMLCQPPDEQRSHVDVHQEIEARLVKIDERLAALEAS